MSLTAPGPQRRGPARGRTRQAKAIAAACSRRDLWAVVWVCLDLESQHVLAMWRHLAVADLVGSADSRTAWARRDLWRERKRVLQGNSKGWLECVSPPATIGPLGQPFWICRLWMSLVLLLYKAFHLRLADCGRSHDFPLCDRSFWLRTSTSLPKLLLET